MYKLYIMYFQDGKTLGLKARNNAEAIRFSLTFKNFRILRDENNKLVSANMGVCGVYVDKGIYNIFINSAFDCNKCIYKDRLSIISGILSKGV